MEVRRSHVLDAASRLFRHHGFAKSTIADIAREARIAVGSVYLDFASKELIVEALSEREHALVLAAMKTAAVAKPFDDRFARAIEARTASFFQLHAEGHHACELVTCSSAGVTSARMRFVREERELFARLLHEGMEAGEVAKIDAPRTASLLQKALVSLMPPSVFDLARHEALLAAHEMSSLLLEGLARRRAAARSH